MNSLVTIRMRIKSCGHVCVCLCVRAAPLIKHCTTDCYCGLKAITILK